MTDTRPLRAEIEASIRDTLGAAFRIDCAPPLESASHAVLQGGGRRLFVKLCAAAQRDRFEAEADGLAALRATGTFRVPETLALGAGRSHAWLVLEWLELRPIADAASATRAAEALAALHAIEGESFGWRRDNYIGATPQANPRMDNWSRFFALHRLKPQFELAARNGYGGELQKAGARIVERLPALFIDHRPRPSLVHGDLWHGNLAALPDGTPALFDPACHHGDREAEVAMSELFGGFPGAFYVAYRRLMPLSGEYETRKVLYNLYHVLNHLNLFGRSYLGEAQRTLTRLTGRAPLSTNLTPPT